MTNERELKERIDENRDKSPYKCSLYDRAFPERQHMRAIKIGYMRRSSRFEHLFIGFFINLPKWK